MRLNRRATFCLGITRQDIDRGIQPTAECVFAIQSGAGLAGPPNASILRAHRLACPTTRWPDSRSCCHPSFEKRRDSQGVDALGPGLTRPLRCLVVKPKRALQSNRSA
jgi:hypothetical protein